MTDISIIGTGCLIVALVIAAGIVIWQRFKIIDLDVECATLREDDDYWWEQYYIARREVSGLRKAEAKRQAQRIAAAKKGREAQAAAKLAKVAK